MRYRYTIYTGDYQNLKLKENSSGTILDLEPLVPEILYVLILGTSLARQSIKLELWIDHDLYKIETI